MPLSFCLGLAPAALAQEKTEGQPAADGDAAVEEARGRYERGLAAYANAEYVLALVEFERAYQLSPNYRVLYNIGQVRIQLGRYARALESLTAYLEQGGDEISPERKAAVQKDLEMLAERTAKLTVVTNEPGADITLDGTVIGTSPLSEPLIVDAGEHNIGVRKAGFYEKFSSITLAGRDERELELKLVRMKQDQRVVVERERVVEPESNRTMMWVGWAATGTLGIGAGVFGYLGVTKANDLESMRTELDADPKKAGETKNAARTLFMVADIAGATAVVLGGVSLYLTLSSSEKAAERATRKSPGTVRIGISPKGLRFTAKF